MNKFTIRKTAEVCCLNTHTAFNWRHKVLDALQNIQNKVILNGVIESDETYFPLSFKGCRKEFKIPRPSHQRGHSFSTRGLSQNLVCTLCSVNLNGLSVGKISILGKPSLKDLEKVLNKRIEEDSIFVTDSFKAYKKVAIENNLIHVSIPRDKHKLETLIDFVFSTKCLTKGMDIVKRDPVPVL